mmetsp:Transcript_4590/g.6064  ORF Transcript_4590/g.6064 Transcript_4590/m.6064 type:complete len:107 (+) Transcript_4590:1232-1552(+)
MQFLVVVNKVVAVKLVDDDVATHGRFQPGDRGEKVISATPSRIEHHKALCVPQGERDTACRINSVSPGIVYVNVATVLAICSLRVEQIPPEVVESLQILQNEDTVS